MKEVIKLGLVLLVITTVAAFTLSFTNSITKDKIALNREIEANKAMQEIIVDADAFVSIDQNTLTAIAESHKSVTRVLEGSKGNQLIGYIIVTETNGYAGSVEVFTAISVDGSVIGVKVGENTETAGLGTLVAEPSFTNQFLGLVYTDKTNEKVDMLSGATVSSRAVTNGVNTAFEVFEEYLK